MKKCKLMFFVYVFGGGGAEKMILNILNNINNDKYDITLMLGIKEKNEYLDLLTNKKVKIDYINVPLGNDDEAIKQLSYKINEYNPDVLFTEARFTNWLSYHAKRLSKNKKVKLIFREATNRSLAEHPTLMGKIKTFYHYNFGSSHIIAISEGVKNDLHNAYKISNKKITRVYNPLEVEKIKKAANDHIDNPIFNKVKGKKIINVARFVPKKNQMLLLKSFEIVSKEIPNISLFLLGRGELKEELQNYCKEKHMNNVYFLDFDINPYKYVKKCDVFALSSNEEGFGNVITEAMAVGTPVVATDCPSGPSEILNNGEYGELAKVGDAQDLANKIITMLKNNTKRKQYINKSLKRAKEFGVNNIVKQYEKVIDRVYNEK